MSKRANGEGLIRQRTDGRWEARLVLSDGKSRSVYAQTQKDARHKLQTLRQDLHEGRVAGTGTQTLAKFLEQWLEDVVRQKNAFKTYESYSGTVRKHVIPALGRRRLDALTPSHVQSFVSDIALTVSPHMGKYCRDILRIALGHAVRWQLVTRNVAALTDPPRVERREVPALSKEDARVLVNAFRGDRLETLITVTLALGLRQGEVLGLRWADIEPAAATVTVRCQVQKQAGEWRFVDTKTRMTRVLPTPPFVVAALQDHRRRQLEERIAVGPAWSDYGLVFPTEVGTPQDRMNVTHRFQRGLKRAGLSRMKFHDLRHGTATLLLAQGVDMRTIMEILGHTQISTTMNTYAHVAPDLKRHVAERMQAALTGT